MIFGWEQRGIIRDASRSDLNIFNIIYILTLPSADAKSAIFLTVSSLTKVEVRRCYIFPDGFVWSMELAMSLEHVKSSVICKFQCFCLFDIQQWFVLSKVLLSPSQKSPPLKEIQLSVRCNISVLIFHQNAKTITVLYIYL